MRRILLLPLVLAAMAGFGGLASATSALANSCSGITLTVPVVGPNYVYTGNNLSSATCASRWTVETFYRYESGGTWHGIPSGWTNGGGQIRCPIAASDFEDRFCYGTAGASGGLPGFWGSGNSGSWENTEANGKVGGRPDYCFNWRAVTTFYDWSSGAIIQTNNREYTAVGGSGC